MTRTSPPLAPLVLPAPGDTTLATLRRKVRLLGLRTLLLAPVPPGGAQVLAGLSTLARSHGAELAEEMGRTEVLAPLLALHSGALAPSPALDLAVPHLLAGLISRLLISETMLWSRPVHSLRGPAGVGVFSMPARALLVGPGLLELELYDGRRVAPAWDAAPFSRLAWGPTLNTWDGNPLAMQEAHPDKRGNQIDLGGRSVADWQKSLSEAVEIISVGLPNWAAELAGALRDVVPVGWDPERHLSASFREAPSLIYLTLHPDPLILAEAIVHEVQHGKLNTLLLLDPVLKNGYSTWTESPVRPDLRPLMGVLLAVHAFVPIAAMHRGLEELAHPAASLPSFPRRKAEVRRANHQGLEIVTRLGQTTEAGSRLIAALVSLEAWTRGDGAEPPGNEGELSFPG